VEDDEESPKVEDQIDSSTLPLIIKEALSPEEFTAQADKDAKEIQEKLDVLTLRYEDALSAIVKVDLIKGGEGYIQRRELKT
jgi:hypothetical protein